MAVHLGTAIAMVEVEEVGVDMVVVVAAAAEVVDDIEGKVAMSEFSYLCGWAVGEFGDGSL